MNRSAALLASLAFLVAAPALAESGDAAEPRAQSCLHLTQVKSSEVIDKQHLAFTMRDGRIYVSNLPYPCPGLRRDTPWMHRTSMNDVCDLDVITVLNPLGGGFMPGASCGLGRFEPVTKEDLEALRAAAKAAREKH